MMIYDDDDDDCSIVIFFSCIVLVLIWFDDFHNGWIDRYLRYPASKLRIPHSAFRIHVLIIFQFALLDVQA